MYNKLLATTALVFVAGSVAAADLGGEITIDIEENAAGDWGATTSFDLGISAGDIANARMDFAIDSAGAVALDEYAIGTEISGAELSFGDQGNVWVASEDGATLADPAMDESLQVSAVGATMAVGWTDIGADVTEIENVQGKYELSILAGAAHVEAAGDYNFNSEYWTVGGRTDYLVNENIGVGAVLTYGSADEKFAFEADAGAYGVTAYVNGDQDDTFQNVGGKYTHALAGITLSSGVNYNVDREEFAPSMSASFAF